VKRWVHKLRSQNQAILVGTSTALIDNPLLDNRFWGGIIPTAVVLDRTLRIPGSSNLFKSQRPVIVLNELKGGEVNENIKWIKLDFNSGDAFFWQSVKEILMSLNIRSLVIEGGSKTIQSFLRSGLPCQIIRIHTNTIWGNGIKAPEVTLKEKEEFYLGEDKIEIGEYHGDGL